mmetsp:Transcript_639/g.1394  ORF Transcript_639/g.1394 Transcript_639/m.1394 type:complete len:352 (+) Transcript_639:81-1136(+)
MLPAWFFAAHALASLQAPQSQGRLLAHVSDSTDSVVARGVEALNGWTGLALEHLSDAAAGVDRGLVGFSRRSLLQSAAREDPDGYKDPAEGKEDPFAPKRKTESTTTKAPRTTRTTTTRRERTTREYKDPAEGKEDPFANGSGGSGGGSRGGGGEKQETTRTTTEAPRKMTDRERYGWMVFFAVSLLLTAVIFRITQRPAYPVQANGFRHGEFQSGLFDCCRGGCEICCCAFCCPAVRWSASAEAFGFLPFWAGIFCWLAIYGIAFYFAQYSTIVLVLFHAVLGVYRTLIRRMFDMQDSSDCSTVCVDQLTWQCCCLCAIAQEGYQAERGKRAGFDRTADMSCCHQEQPTR